MSELRRTSPLSLACQSVGGQTGRSDLMLCSFRAIELAPRGAARGLELLYTRS